MLEHQDFDIQEQKQTTHNGLDVRVKIGLVLVASGLALFVDMNLRTGWLSLIILPIIGAYLLVGGMLTRRLGRIIGGAIVSGAGVGSFIGLTSLYNWDVLDRVGFMLLAVGLGFAFITPLTAFFVGRTHWWGLIPGGLIVSTAVVFLFTPVRLLDFVFWLPLSLGLSFLLWGYASRLFGLIIPGCLILTTGPAIYEAWVGPDTNTGLTETGIMLVGFALGWGLITVFSRRVTQTFVWWPLIPGAVLAMVGWGLYIGGNPGGAARFIGNTGSIALMLFGLYLLLLKRGIGR